MEVVERIQIWNAMRIYKRMKKMARSGQMGKVSIIWRLLPWRALQDKYTPCNIVKKDKKDKDNDKKQRQNRKGKKTGNVR